MCHHLSSAKGPSPPTNFAGRPEGRLTKVARVIA